MNSLISVIIPVYNVEDYLSKCIESVLAQTYKNTEIILVDDGSTDKCPGICDKYAALDNRIIVIHKENGGLSDARNTALSIARGQYVMCVDSDDYLEETTTQLLYESLIDSGSDISTCAYKVYHENEIADTQTSASEKLVMERDQALQAMMYQKNVTHSAWGKLYKKSLFENIRYPIGMNYEDLGTTYKIFSKANKVVCNTFVGYNYLQRKGSIINSQFQPSRMDALLLAKRQLDYIVTNHPGVILAAKNRLFMESVYIALEIPEHNKDYDKFATECRLVMRRLSREVLLDVNSKTISRLYASISVLSPGLLLFMLKMRRQAKATGNSGRAT